jgi:segregation and condensation protein B
MGLKGKIEAIIYAAEEPVSLEQIALLVKEPALHELAEERARAEAAEADEAAALQSATADAAQALPPDDSAWNSGETTESSADKLEQATTTQMAEPAAVGSEQDADNAEPAGESAAAPEVQDGSSAPVEVGAESEAVTSDNVAASEATGVVGAAAKEPYSPSTEDQPLPDATEKAKSNVASKKRAKVEIPVEVKAKVRSVLDELISDYANADRGMEIRQVAGGYRMATKPEYHDVVKAFAKSLKPPLRLSLPALETLAVVAYKQPVTAPEVGEIRGVDSQGVMATLLDRKLVTTAGRKAVIGRPILYKTTKEFLLRFGLKDISELPSMEEFEKLALEAGQVDMFRTEEEPAKPLPDEEGESATEAGGESATEDELAMAESAGVEKAATGTSEMTASASEAEAQGDRTDINSEESTDNSSAGSGEPVQ